MHLRVVPSPPHSFGAARAPAYATRTIADDYPIYLRDAAVLPLAHALVITAGNLRQGQCFLIVRDTIHGTSVGGYVATVIADGVYRERSLRFTIASAHHVMQTAERAGRWVSYVTVEAIAGGEAQQPTPPAP